VDTLEVLTGNNPFASDPLARLLRSDGECDGAVSRAPVGPAGPFEGRMIVKHEPSVLWTLRHGDDEVRCEARLLPVGIEGRIVWNGRVLYAFTFAKSGELRAWARGRHDDFRSKGWKSVTVSG